MFKEVYGYLFELYKENPKFMRFDVAMVLWTLYLKDHYTFYNQFLEFVKDFNKMVSKDMWRMVYEFEDVLKGDLSKYS